MTFFIEYSFTSCCLLFGIMSLLYIGSRAVDEDEDAYVFEADKKAPVSAPLTFWYPEAQMCYVHTPASEKSFIYCLTSLTLKGGFPGRRNLDITHCRQIPVMSEDERPFALAMKNFLFTVKQHTPSYKPSADEMTRERCIKEISPDGNCLFRAISYCLYKTEDHYASVREDIVNHVVNNWSEYADFVIGSEIYDKAINSADEYQNYMGKDKEWGAQIELMAATRVYKVCLQVYTGRESFHRMGDEKNEIIALYYRGDGYNGHYSAVEDIPLPGIAEPTGFTVEDLPTAPSVRRSTLSVSDSFSDKLSLNSREKSVTYRRPSFGHLMEKPLSPSEEKESSKQGQLLNWPRFNRIRRPFGSRKVLPDSQTIELNGIKIKSSDINGSKWHREVL